MDPSLITSHRTVSALVGVATGVALLFNIGSRVSNMLDTVIAGVVTLCSAYVLLWLKRKYGKQDSADLQRDKVHDELKIQISEAGEAVARLTAEDRRLMEEGRNAYVAKLEEFYKREREFFLERDRSKQEMIAALKLVIEGLQTTIRDQKGN